MSKGILEHADAGWGYFFPTKKVAYWNSIGNEAMPPFPAKIVFILQHCNCTQPFF